MLIIFKLSYIINLHEYKEGEQNEKENIIIIYGNYDTFNWM